MQYINDDMNDDLLRRAAKDYPLKTDGADWDKVAEGLKKGNDEVPAAKRSNGNRWLFLLLLIPLPFICNEYNDDKNTSGKQISSSTNENISTEKLKLQENNQRQLKENVGNVKEDVASSQNNFAITTQTSAKLKIEKKYTVGKKSDQSNTLATIEHKSQNIFKSKVTNSEIKTQTEGIVSSSELNNTRSLNESTAIVGEKVQEPVAKDSLVIEVLTTNEQSKKIPEQRTKKFYAGLISGVNATTIKFQKVDNISYDYGAVIGYHLNKKITFEAGILSAKKYYYTDGEYLNTSKIYVPNNSKITSAEGICRMLEVPVTVRYNFQSSKKGGWFASAGVSNYFMQQENYEYVYYYFSSGTSAEYYKSYKDASKHWLAVMQLSGGHSFKVKNIVTLRIEPYLQIPIQGVGIGKLPLTSGGLHVALTKDLF